MWYLILMIVVFIGIESFVLFSDYADNFIDRVMGSLVWLFIWSIIMGFSSIPIIASTTGLFQNYSQGERLGYLTKISNKGLFWKTNEGELQIGAGQQAALQEPFKFSVVNLAILEQIQKHVGEHVQLTYQQWLIMPYSIGDSDYEIVSVKFVQ